MLMRLRAMTMRSITYQTYQMSPVAMPAALRILTTTSARIRPCGTLHCGRDVSFLLMTTFAHHRIVFIVIDHKYGYCSSLHPTCEVVDIFYLLRFPESEPRPPNLEWRWGR